MSVKKIKKNMLVSLLIVSIFLTGNCFGKFGLVKKVYEVNDSLTFGTDGKTAGVIKSIIMIVFASAQVYTLSGVLDACIFNLLEFWTDKNPLANNEMPAQVIAYDSNTMITKKINGDRMDIIIKNNKSIDSIVVFKNKPGLFYTEKNSKLEEIKLNSMEFGTVSIISLETGSGSKKQILPSYLIEEAQNKRTVFNF